MSETESALTPEEWKRRGLADRPLGNFSDGGLWLAVLEDGAFMVDTSEREYDPWTITSEARKVMALANLSLTLEKKPGAITMADVDVCTSAAWYFRKLARELITTGNATQDTEQRTAFLDHSRSLTDGNVILHRLAETLRALVPPAG